MGCTATQISSEEARDVSVIDQQLQTLFNLSNETGNRSIAIRLLYKTLNPIFENRHGCTDPVDVPMVPWAVWKAKCAIGLDILANAGLTYKQNETPQLDSNKIDNLIKIHQSLEQWLIANDEYDYILYGFSDHDDTEDTEPNAITECLTSMNDPSQNDDVVKDTKHKPLPNQTEAAHSDAKCGHIDCLRILMRQLVMQKSMPFIVSNLIRRNLQPSSSIDCPIEILNMIIEFSTTEVRIHDAILNQHEAVEKCLDHFLHLKHAHDHEFDDVLFPRLSGECDMHTCFMFKRHARRQMQTASVPEADANQDIIDKIHCYFAHSYDSGHRLNKKEAESVMNDNDDDDEYKSEDDAFLQQRFLAAKSRKLRDILALKQQNLSRIIGDTFNHNPISRFSTNFSENIIIDNQQNVDSNAETNKFPMYSYGYLFVYDDIMPTDGDPYQRTVHRNVRPKYLTLKAELLNHAIAPLTIKQFHAEYDKARKHLRCSWGRMYVDAHAKKQHLGWQEVDTMMMGQRKITRKQAIFDVCYMQLWHILAVLLYCNFDSLQFEFSKTFRKINASEDEQDVLNRHSAFFWFGKYLKMAVNSFGDVYQHVHTRTYNDTYFHGVNTKMTFSQMFDRDGMCINGPLSTSTSFEVALNFAAQEGIIVEFKDLPSPNNTALHVANGHAVGSSLNKASTFHFNCSWLSDFPSEKEHLFMQGGANLCMVNITDMDNTEYDVVLKALAAIDSILSRTDQRDHDHAMRNINFAKAVVEHQIAKKTNDLNFRMLETLNEYGSALIDEWFETKSSCSIDWSQWKEYTWIEVRCLNILMHNLQTVWYNNVGAADVDQMLSMIHQQWNRYASLKSVTLDVVVKQADANLDKHVNKKYKKMFSDIKCKLCCEHMRGFDYRIEVIRAR